jgi:serine/threonine-protein kinase HipA
MPSRKEQYINAKLHPIFEMHLPEGYLLSVIKKHFSKISKTDDFGLLKLMSKHIRSRVSYGEQESKKDTLTLDELLHSSKDDLFDELIDRFALRSSLSGVQPKVLAFVEDKATLSFDEYIVKSWGNDYPHLALNEYYCMRAVKLANIAVPEFYISDDHKLFVMKRFDIKEDKSYIGFEDMCVLQAKQRDEKYEGSYESVANTIKTFVSVKYKKNAIKQFYKMVVISCMLKNGDAHLKNFGLIYDGIENINIAPAYDFVCTTVYIKKDIPALSLLGSKKWWRKELLLRFGVESCELSQKNIQELYQECLDAVGKVVDEIKNDLDKYDSAEQIFLEEMVQNFFYKKSV